MAACPICRVEMASILPGQLCPRCQADVLSKDLYSASDLRFVGILAGVLTAAVASMPGALVGNLIGRLFDQPTRGCTLGVIVFSLAGLVTGFRLSPLFVRRLEAKQQTPS